MMTKQLRIGTRASKMALVQANKVVEALKREHGGAIECSIVEITSSGDKTQASNQCLAQQGGKGLFIKELEDALLKGEIDIAVHSVKDIPGVLPDSCELACVLPRDDARDVFLSHKAESLESLPKGATLGTCSPRRAAQVLAKRPDLKIEVFRGNADTRLKKLDDGVVDATLLAAAGLKKIDRQDCLKTVLDPSYMLPAVGQGAIGLEICKKNEDIRRLVRSISCRETMLRITAERSMLAALEGSCTTPIAGLADIKGEFLILRGLIARPDGSDIRTETITVKALTIEDAAGLGESVARQLKTGLPDDFFSGSLFA